MPNNKGKATKVTQRVFDAVKILLEAGNTQIDVCSYMKLSHDVVNFIARAETLEEYQAMVYERSHKAKQRAIAAKKAEAAKVAEQVGAVPATQIVHSTEQPQKPISVTIQATHYMETKIDKCIELLTGISAKLAVIIDDLYGTGCKGVDEK